MKNNIGRWDKNIRLLPRVLIITIGAHMNSVWVVLGIIPVISVQTGICPLYLLLGINTSKNVGNTRR